MKPIDATIRAAVLTAYAAGHTAREAAALCGIHRDTARRIARVAGITPRPAERRRSAPKRDRVIADAYAGGETSTSIAERYGVTPDTVVNAVRRTGGVIRGPGGRRPAAKPAPVEAVAAPEPTPVPRPNLSPTLSRAERVRNQHGGLVPRVGR